MDENLKETGVWTGFVRLRIGSIGGLFWTRWWTLGFTASWAAVCLSKRILFRGAKANLFSTVRVSYALKWALTACTRLQTELCWIHLLMIVSICSGLGMSIEFWLSHWSRRKTVLTLYQRVRYLKLCTRSQGPPGIRIPDKVGQTCGSTKYISFVVVVFVLYCKMEIWRPHEMLRFTVTACELS